MVVWGRTEGGVGCVRAGMGDCGCKIWLSSVEKGKKAGLEGWGLGDGPGSGLEQDVARSSRGDI